ncbi:hypothetical protein LAWI1_G004837 [Lachnellula willkommii]|uniref:Uncharacterized protein n=1 Tax=Lachnellula willkommii TaxID=215461 RepID=A0A559M1J0_9HELO|nr:hypothetical protein LAWI1_G004837 [Lachnellula willkommii]
MPWTFPTGWPISRKKSLAMPGKPSIKLLIQKALAHTTSSSGILSSTVDAWADDNVVAYFFHTMEKRKLLRSTSTHLSFRIR